MRYWEAAGSKAMLGASVVLKSSSGLGMFRL